MPEQEVEIHISSVLAMITGGRKDYKCAGSNVRLVFENLFTQEPSLRVHILDENNAVRQHVLVYVGEEDLRWLGGLDAKLSGPTDITILQAVSGG
ncbi:MAG: hypothetical protein BMS9Abin05_0461 [Rhodothermia bacterium]|nr:MAG: hypothetical protein BMS9Abin05_0461 [Rhodothermia bacterium]